MSWEEIYQQKLVSVEEAAAVIQSNDRIWFPPCASAPKDVLIALCKRYQELENVTLISGLLMYPYEFLKAEFKGHISYKCVFMGPLERKFLGQGNTEINSYQFGQTDWLTVNWIKANVLFAECSPPDENGNFSFGPLGTFNNDIIAKHANKIVIQVNKKTPYVYGAKAHINIKDVDYICEADHDLPELPNIPVTELEKTIACHIVDRIEDGSTIQIGLGGVANAIGYCLESKKDLGVHTEMMVDSMVALAKKGIITGNRKTLHPGVMACSFGLGSRETYEFMHKNPLVETYPISYIANAETIGKNDKFISINNALTVDLTGQVCSESLGFDMFSGTGGQLDFVRGAAISKGGKSFIALKSVADTKAGLVSRITAKLPPGTIVTTPRTDAQYIVTEFGIADIRNKSIAERVNALVAIAHPEMREGLLKEAKECGLI